MTRTREQLVRLTWIDAHAATDSWALIEEIDDEPCVVESIGFLLHEVKTGHVCIAQSLIVDQDEVDGVLAIPSAMVKRIDSLHSLPLLPIEPDDD
jgi:hypothetical protein